MPIMNDLGAPSVEITAVHCYSNAYSEINVPASSTFTGQKWSNHKIIFLLWKIFFSTTAHATFRVRYYVCIWVFIKWIVLVLDSDWLSHIPSRCKILYKHTAVTAFQQYNCIGKEVVSKCQILSIIFVINFDLLGGQSLDERWTETDRMEKEEKQERRHA